MALGLSPKMSNRIIGEVGKSKSQIYKKKKKKENGKCVDCLQDYVISPFAEAGLSNFVVQMLMKSESCCFLLRELERFPRVRSIDRCPRAISSFPEEGASEPCLIRHMKNRIERENSL